MGRYASERSAQFYAQTYDVSVGDWPGEVEFYQNFASRADADGQAIDFSKLRWFLHHALSSPNSQLLNLLKSHNRTPVRERLGWIWRLTS